jgi:broad specificity phosphatase PhoE
MKLLLIRHGESRGNLNHQWQGWLDEPLTDQGREQAHRLAQRLHCWSVENSEPVAAVYSSTLARAFQTASVLARRWSVPLILDWRLRERDIGVMQGLTWPEIESFYPEIAETIRQRWTVPALPGGETVVDLAERVWQVFEEIVDRDNGRYVDSNVAIVSHGGAINAYFNRLIGRGDDMPFIFRLGNTSLSVVEIQDGRPRILLINDLCHLG